MKTMSKTTAAKVIAVFVIALGGASAFVGSSAASSHSQQPPQPVDVKNETLPVSGTVAVSNLPQVQNVREPAHDAVQRTSSYDRWDVTHEGRLATFGIDVPEGKVLVIEHVSVLARVPAGQQVRAEVFTQGQSLPGMIMIPLSLQGTFGGFDNWVGSEAVTMYAAGSFPGRFTVQRNSSAGDVGPFDTVKVSYIGYLVDKPV